MADLVDIVLRAQALGQGRAVLRATHTQMCIQPHARIVCPIEMAGEDTTVHIVAVGGIGQPAQIRTVPDPRHRDDQYGLFTWLAAIIEPYMAACYKAEIFPQLWVPSTAGVGLLDTLADRLRYNSKNPQVQQLGELVTYFTERYPVAGQQALHAATAALCAHYATGQMAGEDEHLGSVLTWIFPPAGTSIVDAVAQVEEVPAGVRTTPEFDRDTLAPLVRAYNVARRRGAPPLELAARARLIEAALSPVVTRIYRGVQRAIATLQGLGLPPLADLPMLDHREAEAFADFMASRAKGYHLPLRDSPKAAAFKLAHREEAVDNVEASMRWGDGVARARGRLSGDVVLGDVGRPRRLRIASRRFAHYFDLISTQRVLTLRPGDRLQWADDPRLVVEVDGAPRRIGGTLYIPLIVKKGQRSPGVPAPGTRIELVPSVPDWSRLNQERGHLKKRLALTPWTHTAGTIPAPHPVARPVPLDPLGAVEALR